jgi:phage terminase small subunit
MSKENEEAPPSRLTAKQTRFVSEYLIDLNGKQAAIRAGYKPSNAESQASTLLADPKVSQAVAAGKAKQLDSAELTAARVLEEYRRLALIDLRSFFDEQGNLKPIPQLTPEQGSALASFEVIKKNAAAGDGVVDTIHKFKVWDKTRALEGLAKHFGLLTENVNIGGDITYRWQAPDER